MKHAHPDVLVSLKFQKELLYPSSLALISIAKVSEIGVMASLAFFSVSSSAPAMIVVSSCVNSPPFPACLQAH